MNTTRLARWMFGVTLAAVACVAVASRETAGAGVRKTSSDRLVLHEWGTFTSVADWQGNAIEGLHRTEEPLPKFVHRRDHGGHSVAAPNGAGGKVVANSGPFTCVVTGTGPATTRLEPRPPGGRPTTGEI